MGGQAPIHQLVLPAYAGMILAYHSPHRTAGGAPRIRGDDSPFIDGMMET